MLTASPVEFCACPASPRALVLARRADTHDLGETIAALAARLHAATYELLVLLREFDERSGWNNGFLSCAHWLHWRTGIDLGAAREKVRVAKALPVLPRISAAMQHGQVSYAKVRALTRVATADNEASLLDLTLAGNCAHVERFVRAWRRVDRVQAAHETETRHLNRQLSTWVDDDGMLVIRGRLTPEVGAVLQRALEAAADRLFREAIGAATGDRYQVVLHVNADDAADTRIDSSIRSASPATLDGVIEVDHGALYVSTETSQRLSCDASLVQMRHEVDGAVLDVGCKTRTIPPSTRRALAARDTGCRFPGCTSRRCDAHHVQHWSDGGATRLDNLVLLCRCHHRAVHEGGFSVIRGFDGVLTFLRPDGALLQVVLAAPTDLPGARDALPRGTGTLPTWDGTRFDLPWAIDVLYRGSVVQKDPDRKKEDEGCGSCGNRSVVSKELVGALPI